jgi:hypothetical protein
MQPDYITLGLTFAATALVVILWLIIFRRKAKQPHARFRKVGKAYLRNFLIPDGEGGEIHIEHAFLSARGIIVVDVKDVDGNVFGSDAMQDWTVITGKHRFTFANPQSGLLDRTAAIAHLVSDVPVEGYVAFTERAKFTKGLPKYVVALDELIDELGKETRSMPSAVDAYWPAWEKLQSEAVVTQVARLVEE